MSLTAPRATRREALLGALRHAGVLTLLMIALAVLPTFALTMVPPTRGPLQREVLLGSDAESFLYSRLATKPDARAALGRLATQRAGKAHTLAVVRRYYAPAQQTLLRSISEFVVPTLSARRFDDEYVVYDDYSTYFDQYYDGSTGYFDSQGEMIMLLTFNKDPDEMANDSSFEVIHCTGACEQTASQSLLSRAFGKVLQAAYPTLDAASPRHMADYWQRYRQCVLGACTTAAAACFIANVIDGEVLWVPCFVAWCGGAEVGCLVYAIWS